MVSAHMHIFIGIICFVHCTHRWEVMDSFVQKLPPGNIDATFMSAVLAVHEGNFEKSDACIDKTRKFLNQNVSLLPACLSLYPSSFFSLFACRSLLV